MDRVHSDDFLVGMSLKQSFWFVYISKLLHLTFAFKMVLDLIGEVIDVRGFDSLGASGRDNIHETLTFRLRDARYFFVGHFILFSLLILIV